MNIRDLIIATGGIINRLTIIVCGLALLLFFFGLMKFIMNPGSQSERKEGSNIMIYGLIALFVMFSVWGLVNFMRWNLGLTNAPQEINNPIDPNNPNVPCGPAPWQQPCL